MKKLSLVLLLILAGASTFAQQKFTLSGYIKDASNGEDLIGATIYVKEISNGTITNAYGFYSLTLPSGEYSVVISYVGYKDDIRNITLDKNTQINIELQEDIISMEEVVISAEALDENVTDLKMSSNELKMVQVRKLPTFLGETDIIKTIQMLPGVISAGEGTSSFFVRGGSADQNLILIDEAPVYDPSHLFGLFSVFNADVIKSSELFKGGVPSRYGGRLSSILDVRTKDGNDREMEVSGGIGSLASRLTIEGPIKRNRSSFIVSGRRSYVDVFTRLAGEENAVVFYDMNAKINWTMNENNRFFAAFYAGRDAFTLEDQFTFNWGNATGTLRWNHLFNPKLFSNTSLIISNFDYGLNLDDPVIGLKWTSNLQELSFKNDLRYFPNPDNEFEMGYHVVWRRFSPGKIEPNGTIFTTVKLDNLFALDHAFYAGNRRRVSDRLSVEYGVRLSIFQNTGKSTVFSYLDPRDNIDIVVTDTTAFSPFENIKTHVNAEPRFSGRFLINESSSLKFSYNRMVQNVHLVSSGTVPVPFNTWYPSTNYLDPQVSDQWALGYFRNFKDNTYEFSAEVFYKDFVNITDFADNADIFFNRHLSTEFRQGESWSYGLELFTQKNKGRLQGFVSYTLSKAERKVEQVNLGQAFLANYDRRHNLSTTATYDLSRKWSFGMNFIYSTGRPITIPAGRYEFGDYNADFFSERNGYRLPDYHRLDLSATLIPAKNEGRKFQTRWVFSIYNVYSRKNPFTIYTRIAEDDDGNIIGDGTEKEARLIYLFPILPSVTYNFSF